MTKRQSQGCRSSIRGAVVASACRRQLLSETSGAFPLRQQQTAQAQAQAQQRQAQQVQAGVVLPPSVYAGMASTVGGSDPNTGAPLRFDGHLGG